ncbi:GNAT family N-acetyltransferase [Streptomyces sp. NPDC001380]|uniref:GNAT family N-acetyltransferase n=1 Tax=Streptomyces sp. NPDC001380 TaxID=3364566 RepID=UPI00368133F8
MHPVQIRGPRLALREFTAADTDTDALQGIFGDPETVLHLPFGTRDRATCEQLVAGYLKDAATTPRTAYALAVERRDTGEVVGTAYLWTSGEHAGVIGYALHRGSWGRGLGSETVHLLCALGFRGLGRHRLTADREPLNEASGRVLEKAGFTVEGYARENVLVDGEWHDSVRHALLEYEWQPPEGITLAEA